jgi:hypothetical protein
MITITSTLTMINKEQFNEAPLPPPPERELQDTISSPDTDENIIGDNIDKRNVYRYSAYDAHKEWATAIHVPPDKAINAMDRMRAFIELNKLPFEVLCISGKRICVRDYEITEILDKSTRFLYKSIFKSTEMGRRNNPYYTPNALVWDAWDQDISIDILNFDFDKNIIKEYYLAYKTKNSEIDDWDDKWLV